MPAARPPPSLQGGSPDGIMSSSPGKTARPGGCPPASRRFRETSPGIGKGGRMRQQQLQRYLSRTAARRVRLRLTDDRRSILLARQETDALGVTLHGMFLDAPARVLKVLARFVQTPQPKLRRKVIRLYRETGLDRAGSASGGPPVTLRHRGEFFDLKEVYDRLNDEYFGGQLQVFITWGRRSAQPGRRSIHFGSYNWDRRLIRVNPALDRFYVPRYFL